MKRSSAAVLWETPKIDGYRILREIHRGGQAVVFQAVQESTQQFVALKLFREGRFSRSAEQSRFEREVRALAELDHPNIVPIHDSGGAGGFLYLVMKYIEGRPFDGIRDFGLPKGAAPQRALRERTARLLRLFVRVCDAVTAAHTRGIVHRDLKPGNIIVDESDTPYVLDFGLAKLTDATTEPATTLTRTGHFMGSLPWASPEQTEGLTDAVDIRSDVYSLGVILYQMLTGDFPYPVVGSMRTVLDNIARTPPRRPTSVRRELNGELDTILLRALEKEKARRYQSVDALRADVVRYLNGQPLEAKRDSTWYVFQKTARRHKLSLGVAAAFLALVLGFAVDRARRADQLERALHDANIERGRVEARQGNTALAERLLWREYLATPPGERGTSPAYWSLWELYAAQPCLATWRNSDGPARLSSDDAGRLLAVSDSATVRLWEIGVAGPGKLLHEFDGAGSEQNAAALSPSGNWLAIGGPGGLVRVFSSSDARLQHAWEAHDPDVARLGFANDETIITMGKDDRSVRAWNRLDGRLLNEFVAAEQPTTLEIDRSNGVLAMALPQAGVMRMLAIADFDEQRPIDLAAVIAVAGATRLTDATFSPDGNQLAACPYDVVGVWDVRNGELLRTLTHTWVTNSITYCGDATRIAVAGRPGIRIWNLETGREDALYAGNLLSVASLVSDGAGRMTACDDSGVIRLWEPQAFRGRRLIPAAALHQVAFSPDGELLACCGEAPADAPNTWIRDARTGDIELALHGPGPITSCTTFSPDGAALAAGSYENGRIRIWRVADGVARDIDASEIGVASLAFSPGGDVLASGDNAVGSLSAWDWRAGELLWRRDDLPARIPTIAFSPDGSLCAAGDHSGGLTVFDASSGTRRQDISAHRGATRVTCFSPDGRRLASAGDDGLIHIWDPTTGRRVTTLTGHRDNVYGLAYVPDGRLLTSIGQDGYIRIWDPGAARLLAMLPGAGGVGASISTSIDGRSVAYGTFGGVLGFWDLHYYDKHISGNRVYQSSVSSDAMDN